MPVGSLDLFHPSTSLLKMTFTSLLGLLSRPKSKSKQQGLGHRPSAWSEDFVAHFIVHPLGMRVGHFHPAGRTKLMVTSSAFGHSTKCVDEVPKTNRHGCANLPRFDLGLTCRKGV